MARPVPDAEEQRNDPQARAEGIAYAEALPDEHYVEYIETCVDEAEEATRSDRTLWDMLYRMWEGDRDYSDKEDWQSKIVIEKPFAAVEQATAQIQRALLDSPEFLRAEGTARYPDLGPAFWEDYMRAAFGIAKFVPKFTDAVQMSFITGISSYLKPRWHVYQAAGELVSFLTISNVLPWNIFRDPTSTPRDQFSGMYIVHGDWIDYHRLAMSPAYRNLDKLKDAGNAGTPRHGGTTGDDNRRFPWRHASRNKFRKQMYVYEFWGDVLDPNGEIAATDVLMANAGRVLIRRPRPNPLMSYDTTTGRKRWPLIGFSPFTHPHRFEGRGILQQVYHLALTYENALNLTFDAMNWQTNQVTETDMNLLSNPHDTKVVPGKNFARKTMIAGVSAIQPLDLSKGFSLRDALSIIEYTEKNFQNNSFVTEYVIGLPGYRSDVTKGEVQMKTAQSMAIFDRIGRSIEAGGQAFCDLVYDMMVQYTDETVLPVLGARYQPRVIMPLVLATPEERWRRMRADLQLLFTGVTQALSRDIQMRRLMQVAVLAGQEPFVGMLDDPGEVLSAITELLGVGDKISIGQRAASEGVEPGAAPPDELAARRQGRPQGANPPIHGVGEPPRLRDLDSGGTAGVDAGGAELMGG